MKTLFLILSVLAVGWMARPTAPKANQPADLVFARMQSTPILSPSGTNGEIDFANPDFYYDTNRSRWMANVSIWTGSNWAMGLAYSTNLTNWTKEPANPVMVPAAEDDNYICSNGSVVNIGTNYFHLYQSGNGFERVKIRVAHSANLTNWTRVGIALDRSAGTWESDGVFDPRVVVASDGSLVMYYSGSASNNFRSYAKATSTDGTNWTRRGVINTPFNQPGSGEPAWFNDGAATYLLSDDKANIGDPRRIIYVRGRNDTNYTAATTRTALLGGANAWESVQVFDSCPVYHAGHVWMMYAGGTNTSPDDATGSNIGMAVAPFSPGQASVP